MMFKSKKKDYPQLPVQNNFNNSEEIYKKLSVCDFATDNPGSHGIHEFLSWWYYGLDPNHKREDIEREDGESYVLRYLLNGYRYSEEWAAKYHQFRDKPQDARENPTWAITMAAHVALNRNPGLAHRYEDMSGAEQISFKVLQRSNSVSILNRLIAMARYEVLMQNCQQLLSIQMERVTGGATSAEDHIDGPNDAAFELFFNEAERAYYKPAQTLNTDEFEKKLSDSLRFKFLNYLKLNAPDNDRNQRSVFARMIVAVVGLFIDNKQAAISERIERMGNTWINRYASQAVDKQIEAFKTHGYQWNHPVAATQGADERPAPTIQLRQAPLPATQEQQTQFQPQPTNVNPNPNPNPNPTPHRI
ncbi:MAG: hypothetical protein V4490_02360 [Pseudomonadota bacterium]